MSPADLIAAGWIRKGLIWHPPANLPDPPAAELEELVVTSDNRKVAPCGTKAARNRHRRAGVRCIRCDAIAEANRTRTGTSRRKTA
jgi:hypothetical protein